MSLLCSCAACVRSEPVCVCVDILVIFGLEWMWVCPSTNHPVTPLNTSTHTPRRPLHLWRQSSSVCFFTTQLSKSPLRPPDPAVPQLPSARPSGPGGTQLQQSTQQQPQWRQVALSLSPLVETAVRAQPRLHNKEPITIYMIIIIS